jgi:hypothetical protein
MELEQQIRSISAIHFDGLKTDDNFHFMGENNERKSRRGHLSNTLSSKACNYCKPEDKSKDAAVSMHRALWRKKCTLCLPGSSNGTSTGLKQRNKQRNKSCTKR